MAKFGSTCKPEQATAKDVQGFDAVQSASSSVSKSENANSGKSSSSSLFSGSGSSSASRSGNLDSEPARTHELKTPTWHHVIWESSSESRSDHEDPRADSSEANREVEEQSSEHQCPAATGKECRPCHYFFTRLGCTSGSMCSFCHVHPRHGGQHPSKSKRAAAKRQAEQLDSVFDEDQAEALAEQLAATDNRYLQTVVKKKMQRRGNETMA